MVSGAAVVVDSRAMDGLIDRLHNGDATLGWEGDPRLALAFNKETQRWELWRLEVDNKYRICARSQAGHAFPPSLIPALVAQDGRRGHDALGAVVKHNEQVEKDEMSALAEAMGPAHERLFWALRKDDRTGAGL